MMTHRMTIQRWLAGSALALFVMIPAPAQAEGLLSGFVGTTFGGDTTSEAMTYGFGLAATAGGIFGFELDVATTADILGGDDTPAIGDSSITTVMGNLMLGVGGPVRPYVIGGAGLIRSSVDSIATGSVDSNDFGVNIGAGVIGFVTDHVGIRGDVRYFRSVSGGPESEFFDFDFDLGDLDFWRGTVGVTFAW